MGVAGYFILGATGTCEGWSSLTVLGLGWGCCGRMACEPHSDVVTGGVRVRVDAQLDNALSLPGRYAFVYHVCIVNEGEEPVQLVSRNWFISENDGSQTEVTSQRQGEGLHSQWACNLSADCPSDGAAMCVFELAASPRDISWAAGSISSHRSTGPSDPVSTPVSSLKSELLHRQGCRAVKQLFSSNCARLLALQAATGNQSIVWADPSQIGYWASGRSGSCGWGLSISEGAKTAGSQNC